MDLAAPLRPEVLRPVVTLVVPGTIASGPFVLLLGSYVSPVAEFWGLHTSAFTVLLVLTVLAAGFILDDTGTVVEKFWIDKWLENRRSTHRSDWNDYLKLQLEDEIVGQRYLRNKFTQLKFELSMCQSLFVFWLGLFWLQIRVGIWSSIGFVLASALLVVGAIGFLFASRLTACVLSETRALILEAVKEGPKGVVSKQRSAPRAAEREIR